MRSEYKDEEIVALGEIMRLLAEEISRNTQIIVADLDHFRTCESQEHKATCIQQAKAALANILTHLRYCAWIEAEVTPTRVFAEPLTNLAGLIEQQEALAAEFKEKLEKATGKPVVEEPAVEPVPLLNQPVVPEVTVSDLGVDMDKLANAPFKKTLQ